MVEKTLAKADICEIVHEQVGLTKKDISDLFQLLVDEMATALVNGDDLKISGFGTFTLLDKRQRIGRNPKTGKEAVITPRRVVSFKPAQTLRDVVSSGK